MKLKILLLSSLCCWSVSAFSQNTAFGVKGGLTIGVQKWNGFDQDPLVKYHGIAFIESADETAQFGVFAQAGYHMKGSAIRNQNFVNPINGEYVRPPAQQFVFRNVSLSLGLKRRYELTETLRTFYLFGLRADYTLSTNLEEYAEINQFSGFFPFEQFVRKFNYGAILGGGLEIPFGELVGASLELTVNPDFSMQYKQPAIPNIIDPYTNNTRTLPERTIRNLTFEITAGFRFLRKVEYID